MGHLFFVPAKPAIAVEAMKASLADELSGRPVDDLRAWEAQRVSNASVADWLWPKPDQKCLNAALGGHSPQRIDKATLRGLNEATALSFNTQGSFVEWRPPRER